jgi:hypothetical protein
MQQRCQRRGGASLVAVSSASRGCLPTTHPSPTTATTIAHCNYSYCSRCCHELLAIRRGQQDHWIRHPVRRRTLVCASLLCVCPSWARERSLVRDQHLFATRCLTRASTLRVASPVGSASGQVDVGVVMAQPIQLLGITHSRRNLYQYIHACERHGVRLGAKYRSSVR